MRRYQSLSPNPHSSEPQRANTHMLTAPVSFESVSPKSDFDTKPSGVRSKWVLKRRVTVKTPTKILENPEFCHPPWPMILEVGNYKS